MHICVQAQVQLVCGIVLICCVHTITSTTADMHDTMCSAAVINHTKQKKIKTHAATRMINCVWLYTHSHTKASGFLSSVSARR